MQFDAGIHPGMLKLRNLFTKSSRFICGPCEEICEANLLGNDHETCREAET